MSRTTKETLQAIISHGNLDALRAYIASNQPLRIKHGTSHRLKSAIEFATKVGFYSQLKFLLEATTWTQCELYHSLEKAIQMNRADLIRLLLEHGAPTAHIDTDDIFRTMDMDVIQMFLDRGMDPCKDNAFAKVLNNTRAKPLLRFYKAHHESIPGLQEQICLALHEVILEGNARWIMLLNWAGADLHREIRVNWGGLHDEDPEDTYTTTCFDALISLGDLELMQMLKIPVDDKIRRSMLNSAASQPESEKFQRLMAVSTADDLNSNKRGGCDALVQISSEHNHAIPALGYGYSGRQEQQETLRRVDLLLKAGAKWLPKSEHIKDIRHSLVTHDGEYLAKLLRKIIYTPETSTIDDIWELCRTQTMQRKLSEADPKLWADICRMADLAGIKGVPRSMRVRKKV